MIARWTEYWMSVDLQKDPDRPSVMKVAPTGKAAGVIEGLTIHSAFSLCFTNEYTSLPDKKRESMRENLSSLVLVIIDEMSMVKSDILYQIYRRLQEIKQNDSDFGGISVILCGDLMQLQPVKGAWIFEPPKGEVFQAAHAVQPLWELFKPIELVKNHRQGEDRSYADLLNRVRKGKHTEEDIDSLRGRLTTSFPPDALYCYGKNDPVIKQNYEELERLNGDPEVFKARHMHPSMRNYKPYINKFGFVNETPFLDVLQLKVDARVMITYNIDTPDLLSNGSMGTVSGFYRNSKHAIEQILVTLDNPKHGITRRKKFMHILKQMKMPKATPVGRRNYEYALGKAKKHHASKAKVIQFPLALARAITSHKVQGDTIKEPTSVVADTDSIFTTAQFYVMIGRVPKMRQLHFKSFSPEKIMTNKKSLQEAEYLKKRAINNPSNRINDLWYQPNNYIRKISSLNIRSLQRHIHDLAADPTLLSSDIICLQETFIMANNSAPRLPGYQSYLAGRGRGRGVAAYVKLGLVKSLQKIQPLLEEEFAQVLKLYFIDLHLIIVYRSPNSSHAHCIPHLAQLFTKYVNPSVPTVICGDFNFDTLKPSNHPLYKCLTTKLGFLQIVKQPTSIHGHCIDHAYIRGKISTRYKLHYPYYSDHEAVCIMLKKTMS